jgi:hypothetical protein
VAARHAVILRVLAHQVHGVTVAAERRLVERAVGRVVEVAVQRHVVAADLLGDDLPDGVEVGVSQAQRHHDAASAAHERRAASNSG